ncbi:hypothetical protein F4859DRAFT_526662 [Xylaria cf. heliscus]|nr:hypothetical protein F4859DRAFT_526662 [Xylaria cf. heliscus]
MPSYGLQDSVSQPLPAHVMQTIMPEQDCISRYEVLDVCYQSRFWARALEYYLLDDVPHGPPYRCLMASCMQRDFKSPRGMLRHLKYCKLSGQGKFWCPTCYRDESSKEECSWYTVSSARKLLKKTWNVLRGVCGHGTIEHRAPCSMCSHPKSPPLEDPLTPPLSAELGETGTMTSELGITGSVSELPFNTSTTNPDEPSIPHEGTQPHQSPLASIPSSSIYELSPTPVS